MQTVTLEEAQAHLSELIAGACGEEIVLTEKDRPVAKIVPFTAEAGVHVRKAGSLRGLIVERADCWEPDTEMWKDYMP